MKTMAMFSCLVEKENVVTALKEQAAEITAAVNDSSLQSHKTSLLLNASYFYCMFTFSGD